MEQKSLKKNAFWNFIYTGSNMIFPLFTAPYVTRVLGASKLGVVDFSKSFVQWFTIFAAFGITTYGVRAISQVRNDKEKVSKIFSELFVINFVFSTIATIIYFVVIFNNNFFKDELTLFVVVSFSLILNAVNIDWFYQGIEEYSYITLRNFVIKIFSLISILIFIKSPNDYILYGLISILGVSLSGILNVVNARRYITFTIKDLSIVPHLRPLATFFFITSVINIYTNVDRTLLGFLDSTASVAYLSRGKMIIAVAGTISTSIASVAMPRASYYLKENIAMYRKLIIQLPTYMLFLTIPMTLGISLLSSEIMFILGGQEFQEAHLMLSLVSIVVLFSTLSTFLQQQILVPTGNEKYGLTASIISSTLSLALNFILIPRFSYMGAAIALIVAEFSAFFVRYGYIRKMKINYIKFINASTVKYFLSATLMSVPIMITKSYDLPILMTFIICVILGILTYFTTLILFKETVLIQTVDTLKNRFSNLK